MATKTTQKPVFGALNEADIWALLGRNRVGRIAFMNQGQVDLEPVHYVADAPWLFIRSAGGAKLEALSHRPYVAFEVDEVDDTFDWRSVVARGTVYWMDEARSGVDRAAFDRGLAALRSFIPTTLTSDDPAPFRQQIYGIHVDRVTGRAAEQRKRSGLRPVRVASATRKRRTSDGS